MTFKNYFFAMCSFLYSNIILAQNVGIGTASPTDKLTVQTVNGSFGITHTDGSIRLSTFVGGGGVNGAWLGTTTNHSLNFYTANSLPHLTIATNGNVGIGVSNAAYKLEVSNRIRLRSQATNGVTAGIFFNNYNNSAEEGFIGEVGPGAPNHLGIYGTVSGWQFVMNTVTGNVGINTFNTTVGNGKLNIASSGNAIKLIGGGQYISFYDVNNNYKGYMWNPGNNIEIGTDPSNTNGEVNLKTKGVHGLTILNDGRVRVGDIGCNIPFYNLNVGLVVPRFSSLGHVGIKKDVGDRLGEWVIAYGGSYTEDGLTFQYNGGQKVFLSDIDGSWNSPSDMRLKEDFEEYKGVLQDLKKIAVMTYHYKSNKTGARSFGLIAQNVRQYFPEIVSSPGGPADFLAIDYSKTGVLAIKAIQEQQQLIDSHRMKIEELENRLQKLEQNRR